MNISKKLTSRKFWIALAGLVVGILALWKVDANTVTQISGVVMSLGSVIAYILGEGLVDSAAVGAATSGNGDAVIPTYTGQEIGDVPDTSAACAANTGADQAATIKNDSALSPESVAVTSDTTDAQ